VRDERVSDHQVNDTTALAAFLDEQLGDHEPIAVEAMTGGGSCEVFSLDRGDHHWVLRRAPAHANTSRAHDVLREHRILSALEGAAVRVPYTVVACADTHVFATPFYVMERIAGEPVRSGIPEAWTTEPHAQHRALEELIDALVEVHAVDWNAVGLADLGKAEGFLERQVARWLAQLASYDGRDLAAAHDLARWLDERRPQGQAATLIHGDYKLDNVLFAPDSPPRLLAVVDWEMGTLGDPLIDLAWAMIFHPVTGTSPLGMRGPHTFSPEGLPSAETLIARYAAGSGRDLSTIDWYHVFARWKGAIVLEGSYAKWQRGASSNPMHEYFGPAADRLLASAVELVEGAAS
jgi:aminoglycoside phosphotransferase (APT) family kinase protein